MFTILCSNILLNLTYVLHLGSIHPRSFSPPGMIRTGSSDRDTGFGTGNSSYRDDSLQQRRAPSPEMVFQNGRHVYQDVRYGRHREGNILVITVVALASLMSTVP